MRQMNEPLNDSHVVITANKDYGDGREWNTDLVSISRVEKEGGRRRRNRIMNETLLDDDNELHDWLKINGLESHSPESVCSV